MVLHTNLKRQNVLRIDRASDSVFVWHGSIFLKKGLACAGLQCVAIIRAVIRFEKIPKRTDLAVISPN